jgi:hypothetical protein
VKDFKKLAGKLAEAGAKVWSANEEQEIDPDKPYEVPNRRDKRRAKQFSTPSGTGAVHDTLRLGARPARAKRATGQPLWFRRMKYDVEQRKALEKVTMDRLEPAVGRVALDLYHAGYKTVWAVTQVEDVNTILKHGRHDNQDIGVSSHDLQKLRKYLIQQRVPVKWEA